MILNHHWLWVEVGRHDKLIDNCQLNINSKVDGEYRIFHHVVAAKISSSQPEMLSFKLCT